MERSAADTFGDQDAVVGISQDAGRNPEMLHRRSGELAVAALELLAGAARARPIATDLATGPHDR